MSDNEKKIEELSKKLDQLIIDHAGFSKEINSLKSELHLLKNPLTSPKSVEPSIEEKVEEAIQIHNTTKPDVEPIAEIKKEPVQPIITEKRIPIPSDAPKKPIIKVKKEKTGFERFIGEKLIPKIGILILIIGVGYLAKYSIDNNLINPLTRIVIGYLIGAVVLFFAYRLKKKYELFSSILVSGSMAIMYVVTFFAYDFYDLFPQSFAFILLFIFTAFTVFSSIQYNRQLIAHLGLIGAYAIPFILSNNSGNIDFLFSFILVINVGILVVAYFKNWKPLLYVTTGLTWTIASAWYLSEYEASNFGFVALFFTLIFVLFYIMYLLPKIVKKIKFRVDDVLLILFNSFIFFGFGIHALSETIFGSEFLGLFTLINALIHFIVAFIIFKKDLADKKLFHLIAGLVLVFITLTIPIQLDGELITLIWIVEAVVLFWIGRYKDIKLYEVFSYPLYLLAISSLLIDWEQVYDYDGSDATFLFNLTFLTTLIVSIGGILTFILDRKKPYVAIKENNTGWSRVFPILLGSSTGLILFMGIFHEIHNYWQQKMHATSSSDFGFFEYMGHDYRFDHLQDLWLIIYSIAFLSIISLFVIKKSNSKKLVLSILIVNMVMVAIFLMTGLYGISELRRLHLDSFFLEQWGDSSHYIWMRYLSIIVLMAFIFINYLLYKKDCIPVFMKKTLELILHLTIVWVLSSELIHWLHLSGSEGTYKLGLSIFWGIYSLALVAIGFIRRNKALRIGAISLFAFTLLKLFFYDIRHLETLPKVIVFISLGGLLLVISFLYNKFKSRLTDEK